MKGALLMNRVLEPAVAGKTVVHHRAIIVQPQNLCGHLMAASAINPVQHREFRDEHMQP